jgi:hypothetical protein
MDDSQTTIQPNIQKRNLKSSAAKHYDQNYVPKKKKKPFKRYIIGFIAFIFIGFIYLLSIPAEGSIRYGLCKNFVELNDPFPQFLEWVMVKEAGLAVILDYNRTDAFGQRSLNQIRCFFKEDQTGNLLLERVTINRDKNHPKGVPENIDRFNKGISAILAHPPSLILPTGLPENVKDYR